MELKHLKIENFYELRDLLDGVFTRKYGRETKFEKLFPRFFSEPNEYAVSSHIGAFIDGKLAGTAALYPLDYVIGDEHIKLVGNGNVAVHEDYRGQGVMSGILKAINEEMDETCDLGYLHGDPIRYGRFGFIGGGTQYKLIFNPSQKCDYEFSPLAQEDVPWLLKNVDFRSDHIVRNEKDIIPALKSQSREALGVYRNGALCGFMSVGYDNVEEFAFNDIIEREVFTALANAKNMPVNVRLSGYDVRTLDRLSPFCKIEVSQPAMFRIVNNNMIDLAIKKLGLTSDALYAPYLT